MPLTLHTLSKDLRRLWPAIGVTWIMLAVLANADRWRADVIPSPMEGWMNPLLTMAWACLAALAVLEEPLVGHRNFWTTRPYRWPSLLLAKVLFAFLFIHCASFIADLFIIAARGFSPLDSFADLLWKQVFFFGAVTLPAIAIASLVKNFTHFVIAMFVIAAALAILNGGLESVPTYVHIENEIRNAAVWIVLACAAAAVITLQYARRRVVPARALAAAGAFAAASLFVWLPAQAGYSLRGSFKPVPHLTRAAENPKTNGQVVTLPVLLDTGSDTDRIRIPIVDAEIVAPDGTRFHSLRPSPGSFEKIDLFAFANAMPDTHRQRFTFRFSNPAWERVKNVPVRIHGVAGIEFYRTGAATQLPAQASGLVPHFGRCTAQTVEDRFSKEMFKVLCESPKETPAGTVTLRDRFSGREWQIGLNSSFTYSTGPHDTWISPLHRAQTFFQLTDSLETGPGSQWLVPRSFIPSIEVSVTPITTTGYALAPFDFQDVSFQTASQSNR